MLTPARTALAVSLVLALASSARAATGPGALDSLARYVDGLQAFGFTGQIVVAEGDSLRLVRAMGSADGKKLPVTGTTTFAVGSITKSVTAALIVRLASEHRLSFDDPLGRLLPGVPGDKAGITLRQLLSHTAGLPEDAEGVFEQDSHDAVLRATLAAPLSRPPGARFGYSNAGFQLLAAVAEQVTGIKFPHLADSLIFSRNRMWSSGVGSAFARSRKDAAVGRNEWLVTGSFRDWHQPWAGTGAGDLVTTAQDLWRWARAFQGAGTLSSAELDTLTARRAAVNPGLYYGFGLWLVQREDAADLVSIGGDLSGYHAGIWLERAAPHRIVVITSAGERWGRRLPVSAAQRALWLILNSRPVELPPAPAHLSAERLDALAGRWALAPSGHLTLIRDGPGLRMELTGSEAMTLAEGSDSSGARAFAEGRAADLVRAAASGDDSALSRVLLPVERGWAPALHQALAAHVKQHGALVDAAIDGTVALPWLNHGLRTYLRLHSRHGDSDLSFAWLAGGLLDVSAGEGRPAPVILPVAPLAEGGLGAWDCLDGTLVQLQPFSDGRGAGLRVRGHGALFVARREKGGSQ
jgi:CubicO group peptidase (beta-lactamase class C family)